MGVLLYTVSQLNDAIRKVQSSYADVSQVTATASDVKKGKTFVDSTKSLKTGTMEGDARINGTPLKTSSAEQLDALMSNAEYSDNGKIYLYEGVTTEKSTQGEYYIINVANAEPTEKPSAPVATLANATSIYPDGSMILWDSVEGATGYRIYKNSVFVEETQYEYFNLQSLTDVGIYYFHVTAVNKIGESTNSNILTVRVLAQAEDSVFVQDNISFGTIEINGVVEVGSIISISIKPNQGKEAPEGVIVKHNDVNITEDTDKVHYVKNSAGNGTLTLYDLESGTYLISGICFDATEPKISYDIYDGGLQADNEPIYGEPFLCTVYCPTGYSLPDSVVVKIDDIQIFYPEYTYDSLTGEIYIEKFIGYKIYVSGVCYPLMPTAISCDLHGNVLSWTESQNAIGYRIYIKGPYDEQYSIFDEMPIGTTSFEIELYESGTYTLYVVGYNEFGEGTYNNTVYLTVSSTDDQIILNFNIKNGSAIPGSYSYKEGDNVKVTITPNNGYAPPVYAEVTHNGSPWNDFDCTPIGDLSEVIIYSAMVGTYVISATCEEEQ